MIIKHNESLKNYTRFKIGGIAENFYIPENKEELINLAKSLHNYRIIGGGSNLLINDEVIYDNVISLSKFNDSFINYGEGRYYFSASIRLQKLINIINEDGYGGIEYLYSVPGLLGGAIYMNAGRGKIYNMQISDYIESVEVLHNNKIKEYKKNECEFSYRNSIFKNDEFIILGATFKFDKVAIDKLKELKTERINNCKLYQDNSDFNFGSVFCECSFKIMTIIRNLGIGYKKGVKFSKKTNNWLLNDGSGNFKQANKLIKFAEYFHKILNKKIKLEVIIWD